MSVSTLFSYKKPFFETPRLYWMISGQKLKTEEGYRADIYPGRYMSALCPHIISLVRHISFVRCCADIVRKLCGHYADIYLRGYMSALNPSSVFTSERIPTKWSAETNVLICQIVSYHQKFTSIYIIPWIFQLRHVWHGPGIIYTCYR